LRNSDEIALRYLDYRGSPGPDKQPARRQVVRKGWRLLDVSQIPPAAWREVGGETSLLLREVIYRLELPDLAEVPEAASLKKDEEIALAAPFSKAWRSRSNLSSHLPPS